MKQLKIYQKPEFELQNLHPLRDLCNKPITGSNYGQSGLDKDDEDEADAGDQAAVFRQGIWDEE